MLGEDPSQCLGHVDRMSRDAKVEVVREERVKLQAQDTTLGEQCTVSLDDGEDVFGCARVGIDQGFAQQRSHLRASYVEGVAMVCKKRQVDIVAFRHQPVAEPCPIDIESQSVLLAYSIDVGQFLARIECAKFRWKCDIDHARLYHVWVGLVGEKLAHVVVDLRGSHLASSYTRKYQYLVSESLYGP